MKTESCRTTIKYSSRRRRPRQETRNLTGRTPEDTPQEGRLTAHARCMAMRVTLTSERAHNNQPATNTCRTARSFKIGHTPSLVIDAALHLRRTTNTHNRTHPPERKHPGQHLSGSHSRTSNRNSTTIELQKRSGKRIRRHERHATPRRIHRTCTVHGDAPHAYKRAGLKRPTSH